MASKHLHTIKSVHVNFFRVQYGKISVFCMSTKKSGHFSDFKQGENHSQFECSVIFRIFPNY